MSDNEFKWASRAIGLVGLIMFVGGALANQRDILLLGSVLVACYLGAFISR